MAARRPEDQPFHKRMIHEYLNAFAEGWRACNKHQQLDPSDLTQAGIEFARKQERLAEQDFGKVISTIEEAPQDITNRQED